MRWRLSTRIVFAAAIVVAIAAVAVLVWGPSSATHARQAGSARTSPSAPTPASVPASSHPAPSLPAPSHPAASLPAPSHPAPAPSGGSTARRIDTCATSVVSTLSLPERVGQLLMVGTSVANPQRLADTVHRYRLGGAFLAGRVAQPASTLRQHIRALQDSAGGIPLQIAVDQEGGQVQTLQGGDFPHIPAAVVQGSWDGRTLRARTTDWAGRLARVGVTVDLAPVADTVPAGTADENPPIGAFDRQYGSSPGQVADDVHIVVSAAQAAGVLTTLKHFPGLGRVRANTDTSTGAVDRTTTASDPFLEPFVSGIQAGAAAVMISSARYPRLDATAVAAFSPAVVTGLLRQRLGFTGLVISDDLGAATAVASVPVGERAVRFVRAGGDMILTVRAADAGPMSSALLAAAQASPAFEARVTEAARQVVRGKYRAGLLTCPGGK